MTKLQEQHAVHEPPPARQHATQPRAAVRQLATDGEDLFRHSMVARRSLVKQEPIMPTRHTARRAQAAMHCDAQEEEEAEGAPAKPARLIKAKPGAPPVQRTHAQGSCLLFVGAGMLLCFLLWLLISGLVAAWSTFQDDLHYGRPRTYQADADVGHGGVSHFIATNTNGRILVFEVLPGNKGAKLYTGPVLSQDQALTPVTLEFQADGKQSGRPDMIIHAGATCFVMINTGTAFRPAKAGEAVCVREGQ